MITRLVQVFRGPPLNLAAGVVDVRQSSLVIPGRAAEPCISVLQSAERASATTSFGNIQVLRGVAATAVLANHLVVRTWTVRGTAPTIWQLDDLSGQIGVALFFAISGFLMAGLVSRNDPWTFLAHRIVRIFPTYFAVVALAGLVFGLLGKGYSVNLFTLTLAPVGPRSYPLSNVEWTLVCETSFYVGLFMLACGGSVSRLVPVATMWLGCIAAAWFVLPASPQSTIGGAPYLLPLSAPCAAFAGGLLLPRLIERGWVRPALAWLALPLLLAAVPADAEVRRWIVGFAAVLLVGAAIGNEQAKPANRQGRAVIRFGDWSYMLYLVHMPIVILVVDYAPSSWGAPVIWIVGAVSVLAATALLGPVDVLIYRWLRRSIDRASIPQIRRGIAVYLAIFFGFSVAASVEITRNAWTESKARTALESVPLPAWTSVSAAKTAIADRDIGLPNSVRGGIDGFERVSSTDFMLGAWAFDPSKPQRQMLLAAFCGAKLIGLDRPTRLRPKLVALPDLEGSRGRRIGYRQRIRDTTCGPGEFPIAVLVGDDGRMSVLSTDGPPAEVVEAR